MNKVKLISITNPIIKIEDKQLTPEELIVYCARVSSPKNQNNLETSSKLLKYCIKNNHWSIFEMINMCFEITTSRAISAQILRHKSFSFQEFCIAGDSKITVVRPNGAPGYIEIKKLYERQHWANYKNLNIRVYDEKNEIFTKAKIKEVFSTGLKECYKIYLNDGKTLTCTKEHKVLTNAGFKTLEDATRLKFINNAFMYVNNYSKSIYEMESCLVGINTNSIRPKFIEIDKIEYIGPIDTYDIEVEHESHNYVANKIVVHNSQRYAEVTSIEQYDARRQDLKNRQNSIDDLDFETKNWFKEAQDSLGKLSIKLYNEAIDKGIAKEVARFLMPMSTTTKLYMNGSIRSWITYFMVRGEKGTQLEHRNIVNDELLIFKQYFKDTYEALHEINPEIFI